MAVNPDNFEFDPRLARLLEAADDAQPPAALDAAIRAAARRAVDARPTVAGGGGAAGPSPRAKRNWYVPVSIAAVLVMSVSLVTLVREEKGDDLAQPVPKAVEPSLAKVAPPSTANTAAADKLSDTSGPVAQATNNATPVPPPAKTEVARADVTARAKVADAPKPEPKARRESELKAENPAADAAVAAAPSPPPSAPARDRQPEAFPGAVVREMREAPAQAASEAAPPRAGTYSVPAPPAVAAAPVAPPAAAPATAPAKRAESDAQADSRTQAKAATAASGYAVAPRAATSAVRPAEIQAAPRPAWLYALDSQPSEKWLEQLAVFKREGRSADAEQLLTEFRRRFPDHPASTR